MNQSESIAKLNTALAGVQAKFGKLEKDTTGQEGNLKFQYVQLPDVLNMARPLLNAAGIFLSQPIHRGEDGLLRLTTRLQLEEEFMQSDGIPLPASSPGKEMGKTITYARRIDLMPFLGLVGEEDEDAPDLNKPPSRSPFKTEANRQVAQQIQSLRATEAQPLAVAQNFRGLDTRITNDDIPDFNTPVREEVPLSPEAKEAADHIMSFVPLTKERNEEIQNRLKELVSAKTIDRRKLSVFLESEHSGKKSIDVEATTWENTMRKIETAVASSPEAVKELMKVAK